MNGTKQNGAYYTPQLMADFMVRRLFNKKHFSVASDIKILEPSAGDGVFIDSIINQCINKGKIKSAQINIIEKNSKEIRKIEKKIEDNKISKKFSINFYNDDYLKFQSKNSESYDLIIANPPYIKKNYLSDKQLLSCRKIHDSAELSKNEIKNIWTAFLISATTKLSDEGTIGFILPAEFLQVSFTSEIRDYVTSIFNKVEIFAFNELVFQAEQDVIIILASKKHAKKVVSFYQVNKLEDLKKPELIKGNDNTNRVTLSKWTNYILSPNDLNFLEKLKSKFKTVNHYCISQVGIVTAANNFFILNKEQVEQFGLKEYCKPIIQKSSLIKNLSTVSKDDLKIIVKSNKPCFLLALNEVPKKFLPENVKRYLKIAEDQQIDKRYKCKLRSRWYSVPSVWASEGFFVKRTDKVPRIIVNESNVNVTDAFYRIKMLKNFNIKSLAFSFYNTFSFIYSELEGRFYGGGVLELTPNEFKKIPVPYMKIGDKIYNEFVLLASTSQSTTQIRKYVDRVVLREYYKISDKDVERLNNIYDKLFYRRLKK